MLLPLEAHSRNLRNLRTFRSLSNLFLSLWRRGDTFVKVHNIYPSPSFLWNATSPLKWEVIIKNSAALYKLCAAPSLRTTHYALHTAFHLVQPVSEASGFTSQMRNLSHFRTLSPLRTLSPHLKDLRTLSTLRTLSNLSPCGTIKKKNFDFQKENPNGK